jgi:peptidoglycan/LPS O-acetylase OafA/YrhL
MFANILDVALGFGGTEIVTYGTKSATDWFAVFQDNWFQGLYSLGILNIVYLIAMLPVYFALFAAHRKRQAVYAALAMIVFLISMSIYISNNAAIPLLVLSNKYALAGTDMQKTILTAAGESVLARGEDFTPGSFIGLILGSIAAIAISSHAARRNFGKVNVGSIVVCLSFTIWLLCARSLYHRFLFSIHWRTSGFDTVCAGCSQTLSTFKTEG